MTARRVAFVVTQVECVSELWGHVAQLQTRQRSWTRWMRSFPSDRLLIAVRVRLPATHLVAVQIPCRVGPRGANEAAESQ